MKDLLQQLFGEFHGNVVYVLLSATQWTIYLSFAAFIGGGLIGFIIMLSRICPNKGLRLFASAYIWFFQSVPLLMLLFITGLGIPVFFEINIEPWIAASLSLTLFTSAYLAEVWRGAVHSVPDGQWEAGTALGLKFWKNFKLIVAPQAIRLALPSTVGFLVQIIKATSLAYIIDYNDVMRWGKRIANSQIDGAEPFVVFPIVALIYFCLCFPLTVASRILERRTHSPHGRVRPIVVNQGA